jgi:protease I
MDKTQKVAAILVANGVEDLEYFGPKMRLEEEGLKVITAGLKVGEVTGKNGLTIKATEKIENLKADELDILIIPGGWAPDKLRRDQGVKDLITKMNDLKKPIAIICHGGLMAISAGIVKGKRATGSEGIKDDIINAGGTWVDEPAFREGNLIWGRVVADIPDFNREIIKALNEK